MIIRDVPQWELSYIVGMIANPNNYFGKITFCHPVKLYLLTLYQLVTFSKDCNQIETVADALQNPCSRVVIVAVFLRGKKKSQCLDVNQKKIT